MTAQRIAARFGVKLENIVGLCGVEIVLRRKSVLGEFKRLEALGAQFTDFVVQSFVLGDVFRNHALTRRENDRVDIGNSAHGPEKFFGDFFQSSPSSDSITFLRLRGLKSIARNIPAASMAKEMVLVSFTVLLFLCEWS